MKHFICLVLLLASMRVNAGEVAISLLDAPSEGQIRVMFYDDPNAFGDLRDPVRVEQFSLETGSAFSIKALEAGTYALIAYLDENENGVLDRNFIGIPREPLGFSMGYRPKGPPTFARAMFELESDQERVFDVVLERPLGDLGRLGVGIGMLARSSPYRGSDTQVVRVIPAVTYTGNRVQFFGPSAQVGVVGSDTARLAVRAVYRPGVYEEDDSPVLEGLGDRDDTLFLGVAGILELPAGFDLSVQCDVESLNEHSGVLAGLAVDKSFQFGVVKLSPSVSLNWASSALMAYEFGVATDAATGDRPSYVPGDSFSLGMNLSGFVEVTRDWLIVGSIGVEVPDDAFSESPLVEDSKVWSSFLAINYVF